MRRLTKRSSTIPVLNVGEIVTHEAKRIVGQVVETIRTSDDQPDGFEHVLLLSDGTRQNFHITDLHPANEFERRRFAQAVMAAG